MIQETNGRGIVNAQCLSHGTITCRDLVKSRRFYEEFLGLEVVHHIQPAMVLRLATNVYIACVCLGEKAPPNTVWSHFGFNVASPEEVDRIHQEALRLMDDYELQHIDPPRPLHGAYSFYLQDRDTNWWEIQYDQRAINDFFALPDLDAPATAEGG
ncbi:MAG: VOC family protein [Cyanobacteriota bacterium]|nr:VOC family protein [Cyanobacteriota bacterium]